MATLRKAAMQGNVLKGHNSSTAVDLAAQQSFLDETLDIHEIVKTGSAFSEGDNVWACWLEDGCWYEAQVATKLGDDSFMVIFKLVFQIFLGLCQLTQ
jgi:hypothetical protein